MGCLVATVFQPPSAFLYLPYHLGLARVPRLNTLPISPPVSAAGTPKLRPLARQPWRSGRDSPTGEAIHQQSGILRPGLRSEVEPAERVSQATPVTSRSEAKPGEARSLQHRKRRPKQTNPCSSKATGVCKVGGADGTRTRGLRRDSWTQWSYEAATGRLRHTKTIT